MSLEMSLLESIVIGSVLAQNFSSSSIESTNLVRCIFIVASSIEDDIGQHQGKRRMSACLRLSSHLTSCVVPWPSSVVMDII